MDKKSEFYLAAIKPTRIALVIYAVVKQFFFTILVPGSGWINRLVINIVMLTVVFAVSGSKRLTRRQITFIVLFTAFFSEVVFYVSVGGDRLIYPYLIGCALLSIMYSDLKTAALVLGGGCAAFAFFLLVLGINVVGMEYEYIDMIFDLSSVVILCFMTFLIGKYTIGTLDGARRDAEVATRAKSNFLASMSHEIRTPMNAITGMAELALREDMPPAVRDYLLTIRQAGGSLLSIINDILDLSKIESGKLEIIPVDYHLSSLINDVASIINARLAESPVGFDVRMDDNIPGVLFGDEVRVRQILINILSNAVKYTTDGRISLAINCETRDPGSNATPPRAGDRPRLSALDTTKSPIPNDAGINADTVVLTFEITDTGKGIREEDLNRLFGSFVQVDMAANRGIEGTGLGLAIAKNLAVAMGGDIAVKSVYGKGSAFTVTLPQKIISRESAVLSAAFDGPDGETVTASFRAPGARVLVVDDVGTNLKVAAGLLKPYGMTVDTRASGEDAVRAVEANGYDAVFMDHMMPGMDGVEAARRIRELGGDNVLMPIIALTANAVSGAREMFLQNGFNDFLPKPINIAKLDAMLARWIPVGKRVNAECGMRNAERKSKDKNKNDADVHSALIIDGVDVKLGIGRTGGTLAGYLSTLEVFCDDGRKKINEIRASLEIGDLPLYTTYVHALKSAAANIGATRLSESARELESAGKRGDMAFVGEHTENLLTSLESLLKSAGEVLSSINSDREPAGADAAALESVLTDLAAAISDIDPGAMNAAAKRLERFENTADARTAAQIKTLRRHVLNGEYDEAEEEIAGIMDGASPALT